MLAPSRSDPQKSCQNPPSAGAARR